MILIYLKERILGDEKNISTEGKKTKKSAWFYEKDVYAGWQENFAKEKKKEKKQAVSLG